MEKNKKKVSKKSNDFVRKYLWQGIFLVVLVVFVVGLVTDGFSFIKGDGFTGEAVAFDMYVMSQCPYGVQALDAAIPVVEELGDAVDFNIQYIVTDNGDGTFRSLHGQPETDENIRQLCAIEHYPDAYLDYISCQNRDYRNVASNWEACAEEAGMGASVIEECFSGEEGKTLLLSSIDASNAAGARGSPTIYVNGESYVGARTPDAFKRALCMSVPEADACADVEPLVPVELTVLNDEGCGNACDPSAVIATTRQLFEAVDLKMLDVSSAEGKALVEELGIVVAPAFLFGKGLEDNPVWSGNVQLQVAFEKAGDYYKLRDEATGASYYIDEEARAARLKTMDISTGDNKPDVDVFVMSQCPYGVMAEDALIPVVSALGDSVDFNLEYIVTDNGDGTFRSLHGQPETDENIRQLCAMQNFPTKYMDYILCQNEDYKNVATNWEACAEEAGIDAAELSACSDGEEGKSLLSGSAERADLFSASGSPSIFLDGEKYPGGRTSSAFLAAICSAFDEQPDACSTVFEEEAATLPAGNC